MNNIENSTKSLIIEILGRNFPASLRQLHTKIKQKKHVSYQAVHKAVKELILANIVEKVDKQYLLNKAWIENQTKSFSDYYTNYFNIAYNPNQINEQNRIQIFRFHSITELLNFISEAYLKGHLTKGSNEIYLSLRRLHPIIPSSVIRLLKKILKENKIYVLCRSNKFADKWAARFYRSLGVKVKTGVDIPHQNSICIGDLVLQYFLFFDESYKKKVHNFSDNFRNKATSSFLKLTSQVFYKKSDMYLVLNRYPVFVKDIKKAMKKAF